MSARHPASRAADGRASLRDDELQPAVARASVSSRATARPPVTRATVVVEERDGHHRTSVGHPLPHCRQVVADPGLVAETVTGPPPGQGCSVSPRGNLTGSIRVELWGPTHLTPCPRRTDDFCFRLTSEHHAT